MSVFEEKKVMAILCGLDFAEVKWSKTKPSYICNNIYYRRRTKFIFYQVTILLCVASESLGKQSLSKYTRAQKEVQSGSGGSRTLVFNDLSSVFTFNVFMGTYVPMLFGAAFFFDLFWPERHESKGVKMAWRVLSVLACLLALSSAAAMTVIVTSHRALLINGDGGDIASLSVPLAYKNDALAFAAFTTMWPGVLATIVSTYLLFSSMAYIDEYGPFSRHKRAEDVEVGPTELKETQTEFSGTSEHQPSPPRGHHGQ